MTKYLIVSFLALLGFSASTHAEDAVKTAQYDVVLVTEGDSKIQAVKVVRESNGMGLSDALNLVKSIPKTVKSGVTKEEGEKIIKAFAPNHAKVELRDAKGGVVAKSAEEPAKPGTFELVLKSYKDKIMTIKIVRDMTGLGLADAKKLVESAPVSVKAEMASDEAEKYKRIFQAVEAETEIKASGK